MSDGNNGGSLLEEVELDEEINVFDIAMFESGSEGSGFRTKNNPKDPYQRQEVVQRTGAIDIRCSVLDVVHGVMDPDSDYWATLMVLQFRFDPQKRMRRIIDASLELLFDVMDPSNEPPEVEAISFDGSYSLLPSKQNESSRTANWERTVTRETSDRTTVSGGRFVVGNIPPNRIAKWTLLENRTLKSGIRPLSRSLCAFSGGMRLSSHACPRSGARQTSGRPSRAFLAKSLKTTLYF